MTTPHNFMNQSGFFYIIKTSDTPPNVYKIGKTISDDPNKRLCKYPKYSCCKYTVFVENADLFEDIVMRKLKLCTIRRMEFGIEYYEAELSFLIDTIHALWMKFNKVYAAKLIDLPTQPNGWQYFVNEWLSKNTSADIELAYSAYVNSVKQFGLNDYAEFYVFEKYFNSLNL